MHQIKLRDYQKPIANLVFDYLLKHEDHHPVVALPTGSGKTVVIADVIQKALANWPEVNILVLSHVKEIVSQDYNTISMFVNNDIIGINSNGLGKREIKQITIANIQSVYRQVDKFRHFTFVIIDEAHLIPHSGTGMYRTFLGELNARCFGLTATPFRLGTGYIYGCDDCIFDSLIYDLTSLDDFNKLIEDQYLSPLRTSATSVQYETDDLHLRGGEFIEKEMAETFDRQYITSKCVQEILRKGKDYKKWLIFAIDIDHAEHIAEELIRNGIPTYVVHSKMEDDRSRVIRKFKAGVYRAIVNVNVLTTGFDDPGIDLIVLLRPTMSPVLHVQMVGRGLRIAPNKDHCLVLDFAGNTERLGPINDVHIRVKGKGDGTGEPITKRCPHCDTIHHPKKKICDVCDYEFPFIQKITTTAAAAEIVATQKKFWLDVDAIRYKRHSKRNAPDSVLVEYQAGLRYFKEWICLDHNGYARHKAKFWVSKRSESEIDTTDELLHHSEWLRVPKRILVDTHGKFPVICDYKFD